jgi:hypothetical protein
VIRVSGRMDLGIGAGPVSKIPQLQTAKGEIRTWSIRSKVSSVIIVVPVETRISACPLVD